MDKLLHVIQVSEKLNCSKPTVYKLVEDGELKGIKIGERGLRISKKSLDEFLKRKTIKPVKEESLQG
jgi:excisionase family DNA binding protein